MTRATLAAVDRDATDLTAVNAEQRELLARYLDAFQRYDITSLVSLVRADALLSLPGFRWSLHERPDVNTSAAMMT
jgi:RNA polymerase sigma-70 factor (ECF subfamily)